MKKRIALLLALLLLVCPAALAEPYSVIYSSDNPIPDIADRVRPAVVQVVALCETWTKETGTSISEIGYGSGVYIDERGYIVTNYHIIEGASHVEIVLLDGTRLQAVDYFADSSTDIAVIQLPGPLEDVQPVPMGDSDTLRIGELAIVIGNPGNADSVFFGTVTAGIISALEREDVTSGNFTRKVNVIQLDAAINLGNSGGALLNARGELTGIPTLKLFFDATGQIYEGLGFAIPINTAKPIIEDLIRYGQVLRPRMGIQAADVAGPEQPLKYHPPAGVQVVDVEMGSPAQRAGIQLYDIITHIDGERIASFTDMSTLLDQYAAGDTVPVTVYRCYHPLTGYMLEEAETLVLQVVLEVEEPGE